MLGKSVLLHTRDKVGASAVTRSLRAAGNEVARTDSTEAAADLVAARAVDLVLLDCEEAEELGALLDIAGDQTPVVAIAARPDPTLLLDLVCDHRTQHLLAHSGDGPHPLRQIDPRELVITAEKILRRDIFGLGKYLPEFGVEISVCDVRVSWDRDEVVKCVQEYLVSLGSGRHLSLAMGLVADGLITNAVYNAPRDTLGRPRYAARHRRDRVVLPPSERVRVRFGSDGTWFALSVTDRFGSLRPRHLRAGLRRCLTAEDPIVQRAGGAGLGLYTALRSTSQLVFNIEPNVRTEVIAVVDMRGRMRGVHERGSSLHFFMEPRRAEAVPELLCPTTSQKVVLSDSMRIDLRSALARVKKDPAAPLVKPKPAARAPLFSAHPQRTRLLEAVHEPIGLDTMRAILRGAGSREAAIETALRFLTTDYRAAVAYRLDGNAFVPWCAAGRVSDWPQLGEVDLLADSPHALGRAVQTGRIQALEPERYALDRCLLELAADGKDQTSVAIPAAVAGAVRYVLCAFAPRIGILIHRPLLAELRRELESALRRVDHTPFSPELEEAPYESLEVLFPRTSQTDPPYAELVITGV